MSKIFFASSNQILSALPNSVYQRLKPHLEITAVTSGQILHKPGELVTDVYFPNQALISIVLILSDKSMTEVSVIGKEGMVGISTILGNSQVTTHSIVQISGTAIKLPVEVLQDEFNHKEELYQLLLLYTQVHINQISQLLACQSHHNIEQRFARWLLLARNCLGKDRLSVTQKLVALMLGVRRASITEAAISLQKAGIINYSRGNITIIDSKKLEQITCECYKKIKSEYQILFEY